MRSLYTKYGYQFLLALLIYGCAKEQPEVPPLEDQTHYLSEYTLQANETDVILAQIRCVDENAFVYYYGSTDALGNPSSVRSVALRRSGSDTVFNFILDQALRIEYMYSTINGVKDSKLQKLSYVGNDSIYYSLYEYDWDSQVDSLLFMAAVANNNGSFTAETIYGKTSEIGTVPGLASIGAGLNVGAGVITSVGVGVAGIAFFSAPAWLAAIGTISIATAWFGGNANAGTLISPGSGEPVSPSANIVPAPTGTPANPSPCAGINITFDSNMDAFGSILITNPLGGYDYTYSLNGSPFQQSQVFNGPYLPGYYQIMVKNGNGCIRSVVRYIDAYQGLQVGDPHQGGVVAWIFVAGEPGFDPNVMHGIIAAAEDQSASSTWGCYGGGMQGALEIGAGPANSQSISDLCTVVGGPVLAATVCLNLDLNGYNDWHLPSYDEMTRVIQNRVAIGGFNQDPAPACYYHSSSAFYGNWQFYAFDALDGGSVGWPRDQPARVRV